MSIFNYIFGDGNDHEGLYRFFVCTRCQHEVFISLLLVGFLFKWINGNLKLIHKYAQLEPQLEHSKPPMWLYGENGHKNHSYLIYIQVSTQHYSNGLPLIFV